jgi:hypothetical protein
MQRNIVTNQAVFIRKIFRHREQSLLLTLLAFLSLHVSVTQAKFIAYNDYIGSCGGHTINFSDYNGYAGSTSGLLKDNTTCSTSDMPPVMPELDVINSKAACVIDWTHPQYLILS